MTRADLPSDKEAADEGGFLVLPRRVALIAAIGLVFAVAGPALSIYVSDQAQERRLADVERRLLKAEDRAEQDRSAIAEIRVDVRVVRQLLEGKPTR